MSSSNNSSGGGLSTLLFVVFLVLKLTDKIDWSWWWVSSPLWIPAAIVIILFAIGGTLAALLSR